ncbi:ankyrin repeat domain-containing protein SOWAHC isoform X2 [Mugil cephalus]|uniref:ankyrin repeat domain-containing protein SOWAHC isoform X2 n=1 Tax=Mugil cephalus TaxID=48193 RepID=UPI001FB59269|nr:ankyrin repeat domain-containing protein SOWAHC isoform X2 [Mugil cephalus]
MDASSQPSSLDQDLPVSDGPTPEDLGPVHQSPTGADDEDKPGGGPGLTRANQDGAGESGDGVPALVVTEVEERPARVQDPERPVEVEVEQELSLSDGGGDQTCCDLLSLRSDSLSLTSEATVSRRSEEDDTRSVTASSVTSLFHRVQLDPVERSWWRSSALGNTSSQRQLLSLEPSLVLKKDFISGTALHWAAKQGRQDVVDMMLRSGADVNVRSGYTALHLASIHGHQDVVRTLINSYNAKTTIRDYHGKTAVHYWSGCRDVFIREDAPAGGRLCRGRWTQRYVLPSLLSRSRSQGQLRLDFGTLPPSTSHDALDLHV